MILLLLLLTLFLINNLYGKFLLLSYNSVIRILNWTSYSSARVPSAILDYLLKIFQLYVQTAIQNVKSVR